MHPLILRIPPQIGEGGDILVDVDLATSGLNALLLGLGELDNVSIEGVLRRGKY